MNPRGYQKKVIQQSSLSLPKADKILEIVDRMIRRLHGEKSKNKKLK